MTRPPPVRPDTGAVHLALMRTSNPALNERVFNREIEATRAGWAAPDTLRRPPVDDSVSPWTPAPARTAYDTMTVNGVVSASAVLLVLLIVAAWFGWSAVESRPDGVTVPLWPFLAAVAALIVGIVTWAKPRLARFTAPLYAVLEGLFVGAFSRAYEFQFDGIVLQAAALTIGVFAVMLFVYAARIIKVTDNLRTGIVAATGAVVLVYVVTLALRLFGADVPFIHDSGPIGILFSLFVVGLAALNLVLDFDFVERGAAAGAPKYLEWFGAFGLLVTTVWLYLELVRLLAKLRD